MTSGWLVQIRLSNNGCSGFSLSAQLLTTLLLVGGLPALQAAAITAGLPLALVMLAMCIGLFKGLDTIAKQERLAGTQDEDGLPDPRTARARP